MGLLHLVNVNNGLVTVDFQYDDATLMVQEIQYQSQNAPAALTMTVARPDKTASRTFTIPPNTPPTVTAVPQQGNNSIQLVRPWPGAEPMAGFYMTWTYGA